jgi:hypothetical protein
MLAAFVIELLSNTTHISKASFLCGISYSDNDYVGLIKSQDKRLIYAW